MTIDSYESFIANATPTRRRRSLLHNGPAKKVLRSSALYGQVSARVSQRCEDDSFMRFPNPLRPWRPEEGA